MLRQAWIAWLLILLQAAMFWYFSETIFFPLLVVAISLPAVWWRRRWEVSSGYLPWIDFGIAGLCTLKWNLAPYDPPSVNGFVMYSLMHAAAQFFLLAQVARLWARRPDRPLPVYLPLLAVLVFICLGDVGLSRYGRMRRMYQNGTLALVGLSCLYYSAARRQQATPLNRARWVRPALSAGVLLACAVTARAGNAWVLSRWSELEQILLRTAGTRSPLDQANRFIGFSGQAPLGSVQFLRSTMSDEIALRIVSDQEPGYLRGAVFERYTPHGWEWQTDWAPMIHSRMPLPREDWIGRSDQTGTPAQPQFLLRPVATGKLRPISIWRAASVDRFSFLPLTTSRLETPIDYLYLDRHGVVSMDNATSGASLVAWVPEKSDANTLEPIVQPSDWGPGKTLELPPEETLNAKDRLQKLPDHLDPRVTELASRLFADCPTPAEKIKAVRQYFATYQYDLQIRVPPQRDALTYFLLEKRAAHCEFFASGTAVLLRLGKVPCRYVTGYAGAEYNRLGRYWVVRQRDAHAWVEAHLPDQGWVVVDATPSDFIPATQESFGLWQLWDDLTLRGQMIRTALASESWTGKFLAVKLFVMALLTTVPGWILTGGLLFLIVRQFRLVRGTAAPVRLEPTLMELRRLLEELDRRLRRFDLERATHETLHQFATRLSAASHLHPTLREAAAWYQHYAAARYGMSADQDRQQSLRAELQTVCERLNARGTAQQRVEEPS